MGNIVKEVFPGNPAISHYISHSPMDSFSFIRRKAPWYTFIIVITTNIQSSDIEITVYMFAFLPVKSLKPATGSSIVQKIK